MNDINKIFKELPDNFILRAVGEIKSENHEYLYEDSMVNLLIADVIKIAGGNIDQHRQNVITAILLEAVKRFRLV